MNTLIHLLILIPFSGFLISLLISKSKESLISKVAFFTMGFNLIVGFSLLFLWISQGATSFNLRDLSIYETKGYNFFIDFYIDRVSVTFLLVGTIISFMVVVFSQSYMHRESGFKRFFNTIIFFYFGYVITVLSGNFETLFIGWEILGISSFLLIAFYRLRYLPVKNAIKVFSIYRIGDVGILLTIWMSHHLWGENITFHKLLNFAIVENQLAHHTEMAWFISLMIVIAALAKSAQVPFSAWLPRAMEGPTPSSAIFYGSLSVHIGAFLLIRTFPFWEHQISIRWLIASLGIVSAIITTLIARVQTTIKSQIAYSSAAQIGLIFVEIAAGLEILALIHFVGNAFLRSYQLLTSPSIITYMIRQQMFNVDTQRLKGRTLNRLKRFKNAIYLLSLKEWYLESIIFQLVFKPLKRLKSLLGFLNLRLTFFILLPIYLSGIYLSIYGGLGYNIRHILSILSGILALLMVAKAYNERNSSRLAWVLAVFSHFFLYLAISFNDRFIMTESILYLSGILVSGVIGYICLLRMRAFDHHKIGLNKFHGLITRHNKTAFVLLLSCLGVAGFPITTSFYGEDVILTHIHEDQFILAALISLTFIINGISVIRIYARIFLGHYERNFQEQIDLTI